MVLGMGSRIHLWPDWHHDSNDNRVKDQHLTCIIRMFFFSTVFTHLSSCDGCPSSLHQIVEPAERPGWNKYVCIAETWRHTSVGVREVKCEWKSARPAAELAPAGQDFEAHWIPEFCRMSQFLTVENQTLLILPVTHQYSSPIYANPPPLSHL